MRGKSLVTLAILVVVAALAAAWLDRTPAPDAGQEIGSLLYPELGGSVNEVDRIGLDFGAGPVTLQRATTGWQVAEMSDYRADSGKIRQLLLQLAEAKILERKTANPDYYHRLGVAQPGEDVEGAGVPVALHGPTPPVSLIVGRRETRAGYGTYVRRSDETQSYLVDAELDAGAAAGDWVDGDIIDIDAELVREVTINHADGESLRLLGIEGRLTLAELPQGRELSGPAATDPIGRALSSLTLEDVVPEAEFDGGEPIAVSTYGLSDGRVITVRAWQRDADRYLALGVALTASAEDTAQPDAEREPEDPAERMAESEAAADQEPAADQTAAQKADVETVARQQARMTGWVYKVPVRKYDQIVRRTEDLLKPVADDAAAAD